MILRGESPYWTIRDRLPIGSKPLQSLCAVADEERVEVSGHTATARPLAILSANGNAQLGRSRRLCNRSNFTLSGR